MSEIIKRDLIIAIDGPSGAGKSTIARLLAGRLGYIYIDTGAMFRAVGWRAKKANLELSSGVAVGKLASSLAIVLRNGKNGTECIVDGEDISESIRTPEAGMLASEVSKNPLVRAALLQLQRKMAEYGGVVMDGRDIGTVVFPDADKKFYLDASAEERGRRRYRELIEKGHSVDLRQITDEIVERDRQDSNRAVAPLRRASDAILIDTTLMTVEDVLDVLLGEISQDQRW